jgi:glycosyltransferase involved in cell wall biosynthesis
MAAAYPTAEEVLRETSIVIAMKDDLRIFEALDAVDEDVEIVLALNGTPPALRERLAAHPRRLVLTEIPDVGNLGWAYNAGIEASRGRYILLMDSDCLFSPGTIRRMAARAARYPVVKGQVVYDTAPTLVSQLIARIREFDEGDYVSALSPPLLYDRRIEDRIGGYHFDPLIHWCEDREFDFRLQMAGIPVLYDAKATIRHGAQVGFQNLRSYFRYGIGEAIGQELGVFVTPAIPILWRTFSNLKIVSECTVRKGPLAGAYYAVTLCSFHLGGLWHKLVDPYKVRRRFPAWARPVRMLHAIPQHCTELTPEHKRRLGAGERWAKRPIVPSEDYRDLLRQAQASLAADAAGAD